MRRSGSLLESLRAVLDHGTIEITRDEHQTRSPIVSVRPFAQQRRLVEDVLDAVDNQGAILPDKVQQPLDAQQALAARRDQHLQKCTDAVPL